MRSILILLTILICASWLFGQNKPGADNVAGSRASQSVGITLLEEKSPLAKEIRGKELPDNDADVPAADEDRLQFRV